MQRVLTKLSPEEERQLEKNAEFLMLRGEYRGATGRTKLGIADFREALRIDPNNRFARMGLIFLLIDARELDMLRRELPAAVKLAQTDPDFQGPVGSAFLALSDPERALPYYAAQAKLHPKRLPVAAQLRRRARAEQSPGHGLPHPAARVDQDPRGRRQVPEGQDSAGGHPGARRGSRSSSCQSTRRRACCAISCGRTPKRCRSRRSSIRGEAAIRVRATSCWHGRSRPRTISGPRRGSGSSTAVRSRRPTWAETRVAIEYNDVDTQQKALDAKSADAIPRYDRHQAARDTGQYRLAQSIAFTELEKQPYDDEMHLRVTQSVLDMVNYSQVGYTNIRRGTVAGHEYLAEVGVWMSPRLRLSADVSYIDQRLLNTSALASIPGADRQFGVTALWRHNIGESTFTLFHRKR
jgi:tetratricopeptide (TPR) repeat protein